MNIINQDNKIVKISSIDDSIDCDYFWVLNLQQQDFQLFKLQMLEEFECPTLTIFINGTKIQLPADWNILVYSPETSDVDMVQISDLTKASFDIFLYNPDSSKIVNTSIRVIDYSPSTIIRIPSFNKNSMLCHYVSDSWIMIAPSDTYNKYLKDVTVGTLLYY